MAEVSTKAAFSIEIEVVERVFETVIWDGSLMRLKGGESGDIMEAVGCGSLAEAGSRRRRSEVET